MAVIGYGFIIVDTSVRKATKTSFSGFSLKHPKVERLGYF